MEVLFTSEAVGEVNTINLWDFQSATSIMTWKGSVGATSKSLCLIGNDYFLSAVNGKNLISVSSLQRTDQLQQKVVCSGQVSALTVSHDSFHCIGAINNIIHIWQVGSGNLLATLSKHYQAVTCLRINDDDSYFISAGKDGLVLVWNLSRCVSIEERTIGSVVSNQTPLHTWSHTLPVTDVHIGHGGLSARVFSASLDHTVKVWELVSGCLLMTVVFEVPISSITVDHLELRIFSGSVKGLIFLTELFERPVKKERHFEDQRSKEDFIFQSHTKQVSCLAVTSDNCQLVSGAEDNCVNIWHISSRQCVRTILHKGPISNLLLLCLPPDTLEKTRNLRPFKQFKRTLVNHSDQSTDTLPVLLTPVQCALNVVMPEDLRKRLEVGIKEEMEMETEPTGLSVRTKFNLKETSNGDDDETVETLKKQISELTSVNQRLYDFARTKLLCVSTSNE